MTTTADREAVLQQDFRDWARAHQGALRALAFLVSSDWYIADDLVQETLIRLYARWAAITTRGRPEPYARRVLINLYVDRTRSPWFRREKSVADVPVDAGHGDRHQGPDDAIVAALRALGPRQRTAIALRYWEDLSLEQVAAAMGCSVGTAKSQISRGLATLRTTLAAEPWADHDAAAGRMREQ